MSSLREKQKCFTFFLSLVLIFNENLVSPTIILNKCCGINEVLGDTANCIRKPDNIDGSDTWWWVPKEYNVTMDYMSLLDERSVSYGWLHQNPCPYDRELLKYLHKGDVWDVHFNLSIFGQDIVLNISKESAYHDPDNSAQHEIPSNIYCVDKYSEGVYFAIACPCEIMTCVRKCCYDNQMYNVSDRNVVRYNQGDCVDVDVDGDDGFWTPALATSMETTPLQYYRRVAATPHCERYSKILWNNSSKLILQSDGSIKANGTADSYFAAGEYCGERTLDGDELLLFCLAPMRNQTLVGILFAIGTVSLFLTILLAVLLPDMRRSIQGLMTLAHNVMLNFGYIIMGVIAFWGTRATMSTCKAASLVYQFTLLSSFFWLNAMCIDIAWAFSSLKPIRGSTRQGELKKFTCYSLYVWGSTGVIVATTAVAEFNSSVTRLKPNFGLAGRSCFFNDRGAMLLFFYGPMATLLIANLILFTYTVIKIVTIKRSTAILNSTDSSSNQNNKQRLLLYAKLFCLMGFTWLIKVIAWAVESQDNDYFVYTDILNLMRGVFILMIFYCKRPVYDQMRYKFLRMCGKAGSAESACSMETIK